MSSPVYCNGYYYASGRNFLIRINIKNGDIKNTGVKCANYTGGRKIIQVSPDNSKHLILFTSNSYTLYDTETKKTSNMSSTNAPNTLEFETLDKQRILVLKNQRINVNNGRTNYNAKLLLARYKDDFSQDNYTMTTLALFELPVGNEYNPPREEYANFGSLAYCRNNKTIAVVMLARDVNPQNNRPTGNARVSSIIFLKIRGNNKIEILTKYDVFQRHLPQHLGCVFTGSALTTSFLTLIMMDGGNAYNGRILTVPFDGGNKKVLDYRIEDNKEITFGNNNYGVYLWEMGGRHFGIDQKKNFFFLSSD